RDLDLVLLDRPPAHRREPPETPSPLRHDPTPAVDQGAPPWRRELLVLLGLGPAVPQDLLGRRLPGHDARERVAGEDGTGLALSAPRSELDATPQRGARPPDDRHEDRHRQIAEGEERDRDQHGRPGPHAAEVAELHRQYLRRDAFGAIQEERDLLG